VASVVTAPDSVRAHEFIPLAHPNHYIVLLDASGSVKGNPEFRGAVSLLLPKLLFESGLGPLPPYDPARDLLTVFHFGIVTGSPAEAADNLSRYDFHRDFIHTVFLAKSGVRPRALIAATSSPEVYRLTVLSWAKALALWMARPTGRARRIANRTFLIVVTDGLNNDALPSAELELVERRAARDSVAFATGVVKRINSEYRFTDGRGLPGWAFQVGLPATHPSLYIEAYEVVSAGAEQELYPAALEAPFRHLRLVRTSCRGGLVLRGAFESDYYSWFRSHGYDLLTIAADTSCAQVSLSSARTADLLLPASTSCAPRKINVELSSVVEMPDELLGTRLLRYSDRATLDAPSPLLCTVLGYALLAAVVCGSGLALTAVYGFIKLRFLGTNIILAVSGVVPIMVQRHGSMEWQSSAARAFGRMGTLVLPARWQRLLFYRRAVLAAEGAVWDTSGSKQLAIAAVRGRTANLCWTRPAPESLVLHFRQGFQHATHRFNFSLEAHAMPENAAPDVTRKFEHVVALDLGSESMPACHFHGTPPAAKLIDLQWCAKEAVQNQTPHFYEISPRLRTRLGLRSGVNISNQGSLSFFDQATQANTPNLGRLGCSAFEFFVANTSAISWLRLMPNPKVVFQRATRRLLPQTINYVPADLMKWLTVQVVRNWVLKNPELASVAGNDIHLVLTVPNVYSVTHVEELRSYVEQQLGSEVGKVSAVYESDAVAFYLFFRGAELPHSVKEWKVDHRGTPDDSPVPVVTIDMGRGTTDLSYCQITPGTPIQVQALARTGASEGGAKLTYVFAKYFDAVLGRKLQELGVTPPTLIKASQLQKNWQAAMIGLEEFVEQFKKEVNGDWTVNESEELRQKRAQLAGIVQGLANLPDPGPIDAALRLSRIPRPRRGNRQVRAWIRSFAQKIPSGAPGFLRQVLQLAGGQPTDLRLQELSDDLDAYIETNVTQLMTTLWEMKEETGNLVNKPRGTIAKMRPWVIVAGQGAHFKPAISRIWKVADEYFNTTALCELPGAYAKSCCCIGAAGICSTGVSASNTEPFGTYGLVSSVDLPSYPTHWFSILDLDTGGKKFDLEGTQDYYLDFAPIPVQAAIRENMSEGTTRIRSVSPTGQVMSVRYDRTKRQLTLDGTPASLQSYDEDPEERLYEQLWPEALAS
jgi:hypothetical protein